MGLFKSKEEKRIERNIQIQKTMGSFTQRIKQLRKQEKPYIDAAREAKRMNAPQQEQLARQALKSTMSQRRRLERQLLTLKIAMQMKEQTEAHAEFAQAMGAVSKTISEMFGNADLINTQKEFEIAMSKAQSMEQMVDLFLNSSSQSLFGDSVDDEEVVPDHELDRLIMDEAAMEEAPADAEINSGLKKIREQLGEG